MRDDEGIDFSDLPEVQPESFTRGVVRKGRRKMKTRESRREALTEELVRHTAQSLCETVRIAVAIYLTLDREEDQESARLWQKRIEALAWQAQRLYTVT
jgi:hypothetical protein